MNEFADHLAKNDVLEPGTQCHFTTGKSWNSYNWENLLGQVIQGVSIYKDGDEYNEYWLLQIHNGCDVRGGYTAPVVFKVTDRDYALIAQTDVRASCDCGGVHSSDSGYSWDRDMDDGPLTTEGDELPAGWKAEPKQKESKNWEYQLVCETCKKQVGFFPMLEY